MMQVGDQLHVKITRYEFENSIHAISWSYNHSFWCRFSVRHFVLHDNSLNNLMKLIRHPRPINNVCQSRDQDGNVTIGSCASCGLRQISENQPLQLHRLHRKTCEAMITRRRGVVSMMPHIRAYVRSDHSRCLCSSGDPLPRS